ncbi:MAG: hypothetical protein JXN64_08980 [Spirochaetes bacterium]|nr:hypothetical protein [Spirochaetota bacterium]
MRNVNPVYKPKSKEYFWRRRPSEIRGYNRTLYTTTDDNEYLRVDFDLKEKRIRLYIEDKDEGGNPYYSVINNGKITVERNATSGRVSDLHQKFSKRAEIFNTIPNSDVIRLIGNNYGIGLKTRDRFPYRNEQAPKDPGQVKRRDFIPSYAIDAEKESAAKKETRGSYLSDIIDIIAGVFLCVAIYIFNHSFVTLGVLSAFIGIFVGLLDVYYREKRLNIIKMLLFLIAGVVFYIYGYYIL